MLAPRAPNQPPTHLPTRPLQMSLFTLLRSSPGLYRSFGFAPGQRPVFAALLMFQELIGPVDEVGAALP